jgi:hypothetical protein
MMVQVGSVVLAEPIPVSDVGHKQWMVVLEVTQEYLWLVPMINEIELAGDLDLVLAHPDPELDFDIAVLTHLEIRVAKSRIPQALGQLQKEFVDEIDECQNGNPGKKFVHGHLLRAEGIDWRFSRIKSIDAELVRSFSEEAWDFFEQIAPLVDEMKLSEELRKQLATSKRPNATSLKSRRDVLIRLSTGSPRALEELELFGKNLNEMVSA